MGKKKILSAIAFVAIAMATGGIVSIYDINKNSMDAKGAAQVEIVDTVQEEYEKTAQAQAQNAVQADKITFSCGVPGCTQTEAHQHGLCGIDGCTQIGEHSHGICDVAGCTDTAVHMHSGAYCYPHTPDDGHAYHTCGLSGCTEAESHTHNSCGVLGCTQTGEHSHGENSWGHHQSGHGKCHH